MAAERYSNYEALRILGMFGILLHHYATKIKFEFNRESSDYRWFNEFTTICMGGSGKIGVNIFLLMTGYFLNGRALKASTLARVWFQALNWSYLIFLPVYFYGNPTSLETKLSLFPVLFHNYWYVCSYVISGLCTGMIAAMSIKATPSQYVSGLCAMFTVMCLVTWSTEVAFCNILWFIFVISLGSFIRRFQAWFDLISTRNLFTVFSLAMLLYFGGIHYLMGHPSGWTEKHGPLSLVAENWSILPLVYGVILFLLFQRLQFKSKFVNRLAGCSLGVYLIHEHEFVRSRIFSQWIGTQIYVNSASLPIINLLTVTALYLFLSCVENFRVAVFGGLEEKVCYFVGIASQHVTAEINRLDDQTEEKTIV